jgi:hypothetical protein
MHFGELLICLRESMLYMRNFVLQLLHSQRHISLTLIGDLRDSIHRRLYSACHVHCWSAYGLPESACTTGQRASKLGACEYGTLIEDFE